MTVTAHAADEQAVHGRHWETSWAPIAIAFGSMFLAPLTFAAAAVMLASTGARAAVLGAPTQGEIGFQPVNSDNAADIVWFHNAFLLPVTIGVSALVFALLAYVVINFNERVHPTPSKTTHNWKLEAVWTILPALALIVIAFPSIRLLQKQLIVPTPDLVLKATASQWEWRYGYPKEVGGFQFDSLPKDDSDLDLAKGDMRLLTVDNAPVVPVDKVVEVDVTSLDVIHSFAVPSLGMRVDAIPGRLTQTWFKAEREGVFYGQCSNICGIGHAFMPIEIRVVSADDYQAWLVRAKKKQFASMEGVELAAAPPTR
jgi:cytochrome c oxidase subunit 2